MLHRINAVNDEPQQYVRIHSIMFTRLILGVQYKTEDNCRRFEADVRLARPPLGDHQLGDPFAPHYQGMAHYQGLVTTTTGRDAS